MPMIQAHIEIYIYRYVIHEIVTYKLTTILFLDLAARQGEIKCGSLSRFAFDPDPAPVSLNDLFHEGKSDPCALGFWVQFVEDAEDSFVLFRWDSHPIVSDKENGLSVLLAILTNFNDWMLLVHH